jgi:LysM repeat protein
LFLAVILTLPLFAHAKIVSIVQNFFGGEKEHLEENSFPNSQKMTLLRAAVSPDPSVGGGDINIVSGSALLSEGGSPSGDGAGLLRGSGQISVYVVREGDSLSQIAQMFDVSVNTIRWGNDIKGSSISPGQTLVILPISGIEHTVKSGDTLDKITKSYKGDLDEVLAYNNLSLDSELSIGDKVIIPNGVVGEPSSSSSNSRPKSSSSQITSTGGYYLKPVAGRRSQGLHGYNGIDIAAPTGTPVVAAASGVVKVSRGSGWNGGYGSYIVISHPNGTQTLYAHNSQNIVSPGQQVSKGEVIGYVGATGRATGPHVHFEVRGASNPF